MPTPAIPESLTTALKTKRVSELLELNQELEKHSLALSPAEAEELIANRTQALKNQGRIELDLSVTKAFALKLSESPYISHENYVRTISELYEVFHYIKNATSDFVSDEDVINAVMVYYEKVCHGSAELLMGKGADKIIRNFKQKSDLNEIEKSGDEEYWHFDE